jgi:tRNA U54 and U55 pseudouridine synthase Pus10
MLDKKYFKTELCFERSYKLHPVIIGVLDDMRQWCEQKGLEFLVTDSVTNYEEDMAVNRKFAEHREGRAVDLRCKTWDEASKKEFQKEFTKKYLHLAAISTETKKPKLIVIHKGTAEHIHLQFTRGFAIYSGNERDIA